MAKTSKTRPKRQKGLDKQSNSKPRIKNISSAWNLTKTSVCLLWQNKKLFLGITLVYGILTTLLVGFASNADINSLKAQYDQSFNGNSIASGLSVFVNLLGSTGNSSNNSAGTTYQFFLGLITSLAIIWALRQVIAGVPIRIRDAYYRGIYPLVPFVIVLFVIGLQLVPMLIGAGIYSQVMNNGIAVLLFEKIAFGVLFVLFSSVSLYLVSSSIFALYIVSLPDMTPMKALRSARDLIKHRRSILVRKVLFLPLILLIVSAVIMLPFILWIKPLGQWVFLAISMSSLVVIHGYLYTLYRELINE